MKTLPQSEPWIAFKNVYWEHLISYLVNVFVQGTRRGLENVDKREIKWELKVDNVIAETAKRRQLAIIIGVR